jgi:hypothetical protein
MKRKSRGNYRYLIPKMKNEGGNIRVKIHAAPVLNFASTNPSIARMSDRKVDMDAASEGGREGSERKSEYDPRDKLGVMSSCLTL